MSSTNPLAVDVSVLGQPIDVGTVTLANRLTIAPHTVNFGIEQGRIGDDFIAYLVRRCRGIAATFVPLTAPHPSGRAEPSQPWLWDDRWIPEVGRLADALRAAGSEPGIQLNHGGRQTARELLDGEQPVAPSAIPARSIYKNPPRELTSADIAELVESFAQTASRAVRAGYRLLNLHFAHGYLVSQFLSPDSNRREDDYGGPLENRMRFGLEIVRAIRDEVGREVAIDVRLNGMDFVERGIEIDDAIIFARALVTAGADSLNVTGGVYGSDPFNLLLPFDGHEFLPLAGSIRGAVDVPVTAVGNIRFPAEAARAIATGICDLVGVARAVMADPDWALKALGDDTNPIRPCIGTVDGCSERLRHFEPAACQVNPELGRETRVVPATTASRRILVIGAGPAGAEAATYAAARGHHVVLVDRASAVGGALRQAAQAPGGAPFDWLADYYAAEAARLGVDVRLGTEVSEALIADAAPDHVLVATGARQDVPEIPGIDLGTALPDEDVLTDPTIAPKRAAVIGADRRAVATALLLAERGTQVTLVDHVGRGVARDASALMRRSYKRELALRGVNTHPGRVTAITPDGVSLAGEVHLPAELVVIALAPRSDRDVLRSLPTGLPVTTIGDAKDPRSIMDAIAEARDAVEAIA
jgi:2,4-dienoyl-CoA reductase-like NADH-dependent reductase (Old Yellow Enzyme family)/NADPH-dependent 2,4-dienoyl-CoA reductase/sulfur reductase-like enzyme